MRQLALTIALAGTVFYALASQGAMVSWNNGYSAYEAAEKKLQAGGRPMLVYFRTSWCGYCRQLDNQVFADESVVNSIKGIVQTVQVDPEAGPKEMELARKYGVRGFPSLFVVTKDGPKPLRREYASRGKLSVPKFMANLKRLARSK